MVRKFRRDNLRKQVGNKNLKSAWRRFQQNKYGKDFQRICRDTQK